MSRAEFQYLADTSAVIASLRDAELPPLQGYDYALPFATFAELWCGVVRSPDSARSLAQLEPWILGRAVLQPNLLTSAIYARVHADLEQRGQKIPVNDVWNVALALQFDKPLLARDTHFARVPGLKLVNV